MHFIDGSWIEGKGEPFTSKNPATGEILWEGRNGTQEDVFSAITAARRASLEWMTLSLDKRISYLKLYEKALLSKSDELAYALSQDMGKPLWEARTEIKSMVAKIAISIEAYHLRCPTLEVPGERLFCSHRPHGVAAIIAPFNFPGHLPNGHLIPALLAGNTIVLKASEKTPFFSEMWGKCFELFPKGVINLVQGDALSGKALVEGDIDALFFTGSYAVGKAIEQHAPSLCALEMGGNNPLFFVDAQDLESACYITILSAFLTTGQRCSAARRLILIDRPESHQFLEKLIAMTRSLNIAPFDSDPPPFMGPLISTREKEKALQFQERLIQKGAKKCLEMRSLDHAFVSPGILDVTSLTREDVECFAPLLQVIFVPSFEAGLLEANQTEYGLAASILTEEEALFKRFFQTIKAGVINWNLPTTGASSKLPFGGCGKSGNFRPSGLYAADYCAYPVASMSQTSIKRPAEPLPGILLEEK